MAPAAIQPPYAVAVPSPTPQFSSYNPRTFAGRDEATRTLVDCLRQVCRVMVIVGMTGIGKTALAERVVANVMGTTEAATLPYYRFSLDDRSLTPDFASSGAALLRELGEEPTLADQQDPANLVEHILQRLHRQPCRLQIDSLERLLRGNEQEGWSEFCDPLWLDWLQKFLAGTDCHSQLILTSQDIPGDLDAVASRYPQFWHCEPLQGLNTDEQRTLFQNLGLTPTDADWELLQRIGAFYDGHPLVLQVIAEEIRQPPFRGNIQQYWHHYEAEFTPTAPTTASKLDRSRLFRRRVRQRVEQTIQRLPTPARQMLCASAVFRRPVPIEFWQAMLTDGDPQSAFDILQDRHLVEYAPMSSGDQQSQATSLLIRQHNLIRSVTYALLKADPPTWETAERQAAHLWLYDYAPPPDAPNLETVRGYLEAFEHYCKVSDWDASEAILLTPLNSLGKVNIPRQLEFWGFYQEGIQVCQGILEKSSLDVDAICLKMLGNYHLHLGNYSKSIDYHERSLNIAQKISNRQMEGFALGNLGIVYYRLGQYKKAIEYHQQHLRITEEIDDISGKSRTLGNLGIAYYELGEYERAISCHQENLVISQEIGDRNGEAVSLGNLGDVYYALTNYFKALDLQSQKLTIAREICNQVTELYALSGVGEALIKLSRYEEAFEVLKSTLKTCQETGQRFLEAKIFKLFSELNQALGEIETAQQYCQQALALATELGIPLKAECEALLAELEKGAGS
jgi:tetratricopeptide (TPR) repeat protein